MNRACSDIAELIVDYSRLTEAERRIADTHAAQCPACARDVEMALVLADAFHGTEVDSNVAPAKFADNVLQALQRNRRPIRSSAVQILAGVMVLEFLIIAVVRVHGVVTLWPRVARLVTGLWQDWVENTVSELVSVVSALGGDVMGITGFQQFPVTTLTLTIVLSALAVAFMTCYRGVEEHA